MRYKSIVSGLESACKLAGFLRGPLVKQLRDIQLEEMQTPAKNFTLEGHRTEQDLINHYSDVLVGLKSRQTRLDALRQTIKNFEYRFPDKKVHARFIDASIQEQMGFLKKFTGELSKNYDSELKKIQDRRRGQK